MGLYVYIVSCSDGTYYTGVTNNVEKRIIQHDHGFDPEAYTYSRRPLILKWQNYFTSNKEAIGWEKRIKGWTRRKKEALIEGKFDLLHELASCKNATNSKNKVK